MYHDDIGTIQGKRLLLVEDEYLLAMDMRRDLEQAGAEVVGPVGTLHDALIAASKDIQGVILDIHLGQDTVFPAADLLKSRGIPFIFATGYESISLPGRHADVPRCGKPVDVHAMLRLLNQGAMIEPGSGAGEGPGPASLPSESALARVCALGESLEHHEETVVLAPGAEPGSAVVVHQGIASVTVSASGGSTSVCLTTPQMLVGADALTFGRPSPFGCVLRTPGRVTRIPAAALAELAGGDREVEALVLASTDHILREMAGTLRVSTAPVVVRLARLLLQCFEASGTPDLRLTHGTLSSILSVRRASVTVALHLLEGEHAIRSRRGRVMGRDMDVLRQWARPDRGEDAVPAA